MMERKKPITCLKDYEKKANQSLDAHTVGYYAAGADDELTLRNNMKAFNKIMFIPRVLRNIEQVCLKTKILGKEVDLPFGVAPVAMQKLVNPIGEVILAKEAFEQNTAYGLSMCSTTKPSDVVKSNPTGVKIQQLYLMKKSSYTERFLKMFEQLGFHAVAITVDTQIFGKRRVDERNKFLPVVELQVLNELGVNIKFRSEDPEQSFYQNVRHDVTWQAVKMIKQSTKLKVILKGIIDPNDVVIAETIGVDAIWISNHGGRQLDTVPATIQALPEIKARMKRINSKMQLYIDGGIWKGTDILKCLALGADYVFLGRGLVYSLVDGQEGAHNSFTLLKHQLSIAMQLCGFTSIKQISQKCIKYTSPYSRL